jgi:hypothetical protein
MGEAPGNGAVSPPEGNERPPYEPPQITWTEDYLPLSFGLSCAKSPGGGTHCLPLIRHRGGGGG